MKLPVCAVIAAAACAAPAAGGILTVDASLGDLAARAIFEAQGNNLVVTLANTSSADVLVPADILTCLFWDVVGNPLALTPVSAVLAPGSVVHFDPDGQPAGGVVGGEWDYRSGIVGAPGGATYGLGSSGLGIFGAASFPGPNLDGPESVNGLQYGLLSSGDDITTGNTPVTGGFALVKDSVVFTLSGLPDGFDPEASIRNVWFQYGTSLSEPSFPAPGAAGAFMVGFALLARRRR